MENLAQPPKEISANAADFLLRAAEYAIDHLNGTEEPTVVLALRTAVAKALGND